MSGGGERSLTAVGRSELLDEISVLRAERDELLGLLARLVRRSVGESGRIVVRPSPLDARTRPVLQIERRVGGEVELSFGSSGR